MAGGRPRTVSLPPDDMNKMGEDMIVWLNEHPEALHLSAWYSLHKKFTERQWDCYKQIPEFLPYYEQALKIIGYKYISKDSKVRDGIAHRFLRMYFSDLKKLEDEDADAAAKRAKDVEETKDQKEMISKFDAVSNQLDSLISQRKIQLNNVSNDTKS